jgi:glucose-6-phosphate isomerase
MVRSDISGIFPFISEDEVFLLSKEASRAHELLESGSGAGGEYAGWVRLPEKTDTGELERILTAAERIKKSSDTLVVIGIGGSYLGARAAIELLNSPEHNLVKKDAPTVIFAGNNLSGSYLKRMLGFAYDRDFSVNVISKSGTTTEPAVAFRFFRELLVEKYGAAGARERIFATTDRSHGALRKMADGAGYETFAVPEDIGGRYSVLTAVGLLPIAAAGIDIKRILKGARLEREALSERSEKNDAWRYAMARQALYRSGKKIEILACFEPEFRYMAEWWKQLFGESEGKNGKGLFPASVEYTADLHSMGQYVQDGERLLLETFVSFDSKDELKMPGDGKNLDGLNYLTGRSLSDINRAALKATKEAHIKGGVPCIELSTGEINEETFGALVYFFEFACGLSGYMGGVNPFDQPGVEEYKRNMFRLLGKPGF